jgi:hypothetical protein
LILKRYLKLPFKSTKKTKTKTKTTKPNLQPFKPPNRKLTKRTTENSPKLDKTTQGIKNKNLSKTKFSAANKMVTSHKNPRNKKI